MDGAVEFEVHVPVNPDGLRENVRRALALNLPELRDFEYPRHEALTIVAGGVSALQAPLTGPTLALNGAIRLFTSRGLAPTYWAVCDPQELVADFLPDDPPRSTTYLVASKCHPRVFERLRGYNVVIWHISDEATWETLRPYHPVLAWVSVTLCSFELMARLGYRKFDVYGWDGCYLDGRSHAIAQANRADDRDLLLHDMTFKSTTTWALEAQTACTTLAGFPFPVHVHGPGFIGAMLREYLSKRVVTDFTF